MAKNYPSFKELSRLGLVFDQARAWITPENRRRIAQDVALTTAANTGVPVELTAYIDPAVIEILTAARMARQIFSEERKGDRTTPYVKFRVAESTGNSGPYSDYGDGPTSSTNYEWISRQQFIHQTSIYYGDLELAVSSQAKIDLAADKQKAAALALDTLQNKSYLLGIEDYEIYGIFNDPNLPDSIVASATGGADNSTSWDDKTTVQIFNDILTLFQKLVEQTQGLIDHNSKLKLCLSPGRNVLLGAATDFNVTVKDMLDKYFGDLEIITVPELSSMTAGETAFMIAPEVAGQKTGTLCFGEKINAGRIVPSLSSYAQKFTASTYGGIVLMPAAFASMTGF